MVVVMGFGRFFGDIWILNFKSKFLGFIRGFN